MEEDSKKNKSIILGFAHNDKDNHKRITKGENFYLCGGTKDAHDNMIESVLEFNALRMKYGKSLDELTESEYFDIANEIKRKNINWHYSPNYFKK